jgi:uncharacterized protein YggE
MIRTLRAGALAGLMLTTGLAALPAVADPVMAVDSRMFEATTLNLSAYGETTLAPDMATITLGVQTRAPTAAQAMADNAGRMSAVMAALRHAGIADKDVQTSNLSLNAEYAYADGKPPALTGYAASNDVVVKVYDLARLGPVADAVTSAGANQISGISLGLKDPSAAEDAARRIAVKALAAKASLYADATGLRLVRLVNLSEGGGYAPQPIRPMPMMAMAKAVATPVAAGELTVRVDVTGIYELAK